MAIDPLFKDILDKQFMPVREIKVKHITTNNKLLFKDILDKQFVWVREIKVKHIPTNNKLAKCPGCKHYTISGQRHCDPRDYTPDYMWDDDWLIEQPF